MSTEQSIDGLWEEFRAKENEFYALRMRVVARQAELLPILRKALTGVPGRGTALRLLLMLNEQLRQSLLPELIDQASVGHSDIALCREVIKSLPRAWLSKRIESEMRPILENGDAEEHWRFAELLDELELTEALERLVSRCARSLDPDILEVADDFSAREEQVAVTMNAFGISPDTMVVTSKYVTQERQPILFVSHEADEDGDLWQFHSGNGDYSSEQLQLVRLETVMQLHPTIESVAKLPVGSCARRKTTDDAWLFEIDH